MELVENKVEATKKLYDELGAKEYVYELKQEYSNIAFDQLDKLSLPSKNKNTLKVLATSLLNREY